MTTPSFLTQLPNKRSDILVFRDEEILTTWKVSFASGRFYRKADDLWATQDIKFDESLSESDVLSLMYDKAAKYRKRVLKAGGWNFRNCYGDAVHVSL